MLSPETWTARVERATMLYFESNYDVNLVLGLQQIQESPGFSEYLKLYIETDPIGRARWESLKPILIG
jgi:hypothetical protein